MFRRLSEIRDRMGIRAPAVLMVSGCAAVALTLWHQRGQEVVARAITEAPVAVVTSTQTATVGRVLVGLGDAVASGQPLISLESPELSAQKKLVEARIAHALRAAELARLELIRGLKQEERSRALMLIEAQRDLQATVAERTRRHAEADVAGGMLSEADKLREAGLIDPYRAREQAALYAERTSLEAESQAMSKLETQRLTALKKELTELGVSDELLAASERVHAAELEMLTRERDELEARLLALTVRAPHAGRVSELASAGSVLQPGDLVARVAPHVASRVAMYAAQSEGPPAVSGDAVAFTVTLADGRTCRGQDQVSVTSEALPKPAGLSGLAGIDVSGFPVRVRLPEHCTLPIGQLVELRLEHR
jgi:multidrug resistance efflux pump